MHQVGVVVQDLDATDVFVAFGLVLEGEQEMQGDRIGAVVGLESVHSRVAFLRASGSVPEGLIGELAQTT